MGHINNYHRKVFFDYHMSQSVTNIAAGFDAAKWAEDLEKANVQVVSAFARCGYGYRYYQKGTAGNLHPYLPEGMDMVEDTVRECHKRGIKVIGYCHISSGEYHKYHRPEAIKIDRNGKPLDMDLCFNVPGIKEELLLQFEELAANYDLDALFFDSVCSMTPCHCRYCQERFERETGCPEIPKSSQDENYEIYIEWLGKCYQEFRGEIADAVHRGDKDMPVSMNWGYTVRDPEMPTDAIGFLSQDTWPTNMLASEQTQGKNWAFAGKPYSLMDNMSLQWWSSYDIKNVDTLIQEAMEPIINGGRFWMGFQMYQDHSLAPFVMQTIQKVFEYVKDVEDHFENKEIMPYIGVLNGKEQLRFRRNKGEFDARVDETSMYGLNKALTTSGIPYNSMLEETLIQHLPEFKAVIIANDQYVSENLYRKLKDYVSGGGKLILTGKSGSVDSNGTLVENGDFEELTGVKILGESQHSYSYIRVLDAALDGDETHMPMLCAEYFTYVKAESAASLAKVIHSVSKKEHEQFDWSEFPSFLQPGEETEYDAVTVQSYGKGKVCYLAADVFRGYAGTNNWRLKNFIKNLINDLLLEKEAVRTDAPNVVELTLMKDKETGDLQINLLNTMRSIPMRERSDRLENAICENILPVYNIQVSLPAAQEPKAVYTLQSKEELGWCYEEGRISFKVPSLVIYEGVVISF